MNNGINIKILRPVKIDSIEEKTEMRNLHKQVGVLKTSTTSTPVSVLIITEENACNCKK